MTNQEREKKQLAPLVLNDALSQAAALKAEYMLANNFWAHNGPDGTTPWYFFKEVGYNYTYAGENLARGFTDSSDVMTAWMNSPTHRENILSSNYEEIGFAVKKGKLLGEDTTLIVEMFGNTNALPVNAREQGNEMNALQEKQVLPASDETGAGNSDNVVLKTTSLLSSRALSSNIALFVLVAFIGGLILDMVVVYRKKITRVVGHNLDHIFFFAAIIFIVVVSTRGLVL